MSVDERALLRLLQRCVAQGLGASLRFVFDAGSASRSRLRSSRMSSALSFASSQVSRALSFALPQLCWVLPSSSFSLPFTRSLSTRPSFRSAVPCLPRASRRETVSTRAVGGTPNSSARRCTDMETWIWIVIAAVIVAAIVVVAALWGMRARRRSHLRDRFRAGVRPRGVRLGQARRRTAARVCRERAPGARHQAAVGGRPRAVPGGVA